jgi:hypothetical protein
MNKITFTFLFFISALNGICQTLSPNSEKIKKAYDQLKVNDSSETLQLNYISAFPNSKEEFLAIFNPDDHKQLSNVSDQYLDMLLVLGDKYPTKVLRKSMNIGKRLKWDADAIGYLQHLIVDVANKHPNVFIEQIDRLHENEKTSLIRFLADVENHRAYPEYQDLIDKLNAAKQNTISKMFIQARKERMKHHHN